MIAQTKPKLIKRPADLWCENCGSMDSIDAIRSMHPGALACCPERQMKTIDQVWFKLPPPIRREYWAVTEYGRLAPNKEIIRKVRDALAAKGKP